MDPCKTAAPTQYDLHQPAIVPASGRRSVEHPDTCVASRRQAPAAPAQSAVACRRTAMQRVYPPLSTARAAAQLHSHSLFHTTYHDQHVTL